MGKRELNKKKKEDKTPFSWRRAFALLFALALALGLVTAAALPNLPGIDSLRRTLSYNKAARDSEGKAELFRYDNDRSAQYAMLGDRLIVASSTRVVLLGMNGSEELWSAMVNFTHPAIVCGSQTALVYDVGGKSAFLLDAKGLLRALDEECGNGILSASLNASDYLTLTVLKSGYRSAVTAYSRAGTPVFTFNSSERYVSDACVLSDNRTLAAVMLGEADGVFASMLTLYSLGSEKPESELTLSGSMVLSLQGLGGNLAAVEDDRLTLFSPDGALAGSLRYEYPYLRARAAGSGFLVLLLSRYRSGSTLRLVSAGPTGEVLGSLYERREVVDVSAAGRYIAVLYAGSLTVYNSDFTEYATLESSDFAKRAIMRGDGTVLLLGAQRAWLYVP